MKNNSSFNETTHTVDNQIIINAFGHCSAIFSQFVQSRIAPEFELSENENLNLNDILDLNEQNYCLLKTMLFGGIEGSSFLIMKPAEVDYLIEDLLKMTSRDLEKAFLMELDNIVTAAVVSTLSDALGIPFYGDVPHHAIMSGEKCMNEITKSFSSQKANPDKTILHFHFSIEGQPSWKPVFLWIFDNLMIE